MQITYCPPGYAHGYCPYDAPTVCEDLAKDTHDVRIGLSVYASFFKLGTAAAKKIENQMHRESILNQRNPL